MKSEIVGISMKNEIAFPSKIENISIVEKFIDDISSQFNLTEEVYGNIFVAVVEGVNNAILHGNKLDPKKQVLIKYEICDTFICFTIADQGNGFNFSNIPDPTLPENLEKPHGRGVFLMQKLTDEIEFEKNGAIVKLKFRFS